MTTYNWLIIALWLSLGAVWAVSAIGMKRNVGKRSWTRENWLRASIVVLVLLVLHTPVLKDALRAEHAYAARSVPMGLGGVSLCALGIGLAVLARAHLGRNWGMPMSRKADPELVTTGPYAFIRHPIYAGILLAMLGSAIAQSVAWLLPLVLFGAYFVYSARREEQLMITQFPEGYPAYMKRTKMLLPFVL